ncbi:hypothetical protein [Candidatus Electrothrix sp.]
MRRGGNLSLLWADQELGQEKQPMLQVKIPLGQEEMALEQEKTTL